MLEEARSGWEWLGTVRMVVRGWRWLGVIGKAWVGLRKIRSSRETVRIVGIVEVARMVGSG
jgi:hypothetical protein